MNHLKWISLFHILCALTVLGVGLVSCAPLTGNPIDLATALAKPTEIASPVLTPEPTASPEPTATPSATATPEPTAIPTETGPKVGDTWVESNWKGLGETRITIKQIEGQPYITSAEDLKDLPIVNIAVQADSQVGSGKMGRIALLNMKLVGYEIDSVKLLDQDMDLDGKPDESEVGYLTFAYKTEDGVSMLLRIPAGMAVSSNTTGLGVDTIENVLEFYPIGSVVDVLNIFIHLPDGNLTAKNLDDIVKKQPYNWWQMHTRIESGAFWGDENMAMTNDEVISLLKGSKGQVLDFSTGGAFLASI